MSYHDSNFIIGQRAAERLASVLQGVNLRASGMADWCAYFIPFKVLHLFMLYFFIIAFTCSCSFLDIILSKKLHFIRVLTKT